ncbi:MAG: phosphodiester glycosidase family protein [Candidatus Margulisiibacteriota bacterium]
MQCQKTCLIVNGGFFEPDGSPTGLLIEGGRQRAPLSNRALMSGTFMVKNGLFQMIRSGDYIADPGISFAVQNGPMLVEPGPRFGIVRNDLNRQPRTIIALDRAGCAHLVVLKTPVSLFVSQYIVARVVRNISYALNLDGGPSSYIYYNDGKKQVSFGDPTIPAYFIKIALQ